MKIYTCSEISEYILWGIILFILLYAPPLLPYTNLILGMFLLGIILIRQHFTTFTPPRKLMKLVYTRPELSPLDFLRFGP